MAFRTNVSLFISLLFLFSFAHFTICRASASEVDDESAFVYAEGTGKGPEKWGHINPDWQACENGKFQSPIDLLDERVQAFPNLGKLRRDYKPAPATVKNRGHDITVKWKGNAGKITINGTDYNLLQCHWHSPSEHTFNGSRITFLSYLLIVHDDVYNKKVKWKGNAGKITINGTDYNLLQCHWHSPSEHTFNGSRYDLELHIIHISTQGEIAVIGIVYKYGRPDSFLSKIFNGIRSIEKEEIDLGVINPGEIKFGSRKYYRYIGSLTVPPCTEGVVWTIINKVRTVSREQVRGLKDLVHDGFDANARPIQLRDGREVMLYTPRENGGST